MGALLEPTRRQSRGVLRSAAARGGGSRVRCLVNLALSFPMHIFLSVNGIDGVCVRADCSSAGNSILPVGLMSSSEHVRGPGEA